MGGAVRSPKRNPRRARDRTAACRSPAAPWRLQRDSLVAASGEELSKPGFHDQEWMIATVPGTVLTSYLNDGAVPDPNYGGNQLPISDSFFYADFCIATSSYRRRGRRGSMSG